MALLIWKNMAAIRCEIKYFSDIFYNNNYNDEKKKE